MFELLKNGIPNGQLTTRNWKSNIRHHVALHDNYADLESWDGPETADIVYDDVSGSFSQILVDKAGISPHVFPTPGEGSVKYYFEVKTTTTDCNEKFWMSRYQVRRVSQTPPMSYAITSGPANVDADEEYGDPVGTTLQRNLHHFPRVQVGSGRYGDADDYRSGDTSEGEEIGIHGGDVHCPTNIAPNNVCALTHICGDMCRHTFVMMSIGKKKGFRGTSVPRQPRLYRSLPKEAIVSR